MRDASRFFFETNHVVEPIFITTCRSGPSRPSVNPSERDTTGCREGEINFAGVKIATPPVGAEAVLL